ncbi:DUF2189 domain-containing protein [Pseudohongiella spirulinae]|uniref:Cytochrome C oxidase subunit I n=1 Tax=Pseudohongiella spirulinae TaxID=1249552 RepID=A0A0S2K9Q2_9GAMM|nr:DUF2189 domain-containing protein [Pseudohongiella spirulinae]ALO44969.1 cytochrome C oxidase subunit I [Pseudohongiella spirulinae]
MRAHTDVSIDSGPHFEIRNISLIDLRESMRRGLDDFFARPTHGIFITLIYALVAVFAALIGLGENPLPLVFPLISGIALIGPLAACGLYELSRRREAGLDYAWWYVFDVFRSPSRGAIALMGLVLAVLFMTWMMTAQALYGAYFGAEQPENMLALLQQVMTTSAGWQLMMSGLFIGFLYSVIVFVTTVVSLPLLIHHKVGLPHAVGVSIAVVLKNWKTMAAWYLLVIAMVALAAVPLFIGLAIVVPVLGHATWHLYRRSCRRCDSGLEQ